jgi:hypothetical protein
LKNLLIISLICLTCLIACSGKDKISIDNTPPIPPILIPHLGDLGDPAVEYNGQTMYPNDDNNGIDAVPDGDWIRVSWEHFLDTDLDYVKIFRFDDSPNDPVHIASVIDSVQYDPTKDYYIDSKIPLQTNIRYSYFIEVIDKAGNSALSDTVSYSLLSKQILTGPPDNSIVSPSNVTFSWQKSGIVSKFRLLVFDENHIYLWQKDVQVTTEGDFFDAVWPNNPPQQYTGQLVYWRVDALEWDSELNMFIGSESNERVLYLSTKK